VGNGGRCYKVHDYDVAPACQCYSGICVLYPNNIIGECSADAKLATTSSYSQEVSVPSGGSQSVSQGVTGQLSTGGQSWGSKTVSQSSNEQSSGTANSKTIRSKINFILVLAHLIMMCCLF